MKITYYGHSCFILETSGKKILFDPFVSFNPLASEKGITAENLEADYILISHGHQDHIGDAVSVAKRTGALVYCNWEIHEWLQKQGVTSTHPMNIGGSVQNGDFTLKMVTALHSSSLPDGTYGGNPGGFLVYAEDKTIYYAGDTGLTMDMKLIGDSHKPDLAFLPIGDNFTMGYQDAITCAHFIRCNRIIGMHYDTFGYIKIDHQIVKDAFEKASKELLLMEIGASENF